MNKDDLLKSFQELREALLSNDLELLSEIYSDNYEGINIYGGVDTKNTVMEYYKPDV